MTHRRTRATAALTLLVAVSLVSACAPATDTGSAGDAVGAASETSAPTPTPLPDTVVTPTPYDGPATIASEPLPAVPVGNAVEIGGGVVVEVTDVSTIDIEPTAPGDIAGAGVAVDVSITNGGDDALDLAGVAVNANYGTRPASPSASGPSEPFTGQLASGASASATYVFLTPRDVEDDLVIDVQHNAFESVVVVEPRP